MQRELCKGLTILCLVGTVSLGAGPPPMPTVPLGEVEPGLQGRGWSVFSGQEPEPFEVEVLGVWRNVAPDRSYILAKLGGHGLEETGVVAGMSGSPVYVGDRLLGAVAFSWSFATEAIAGVTPIDAMRRISLEPGPAAPTSGAESVDLVDMVTLDRVDERLADALRLLGGGGEQGAGGLLWSTVGMGESTRSLLSRAVGPVTAAGASDALDDELAPGESVAAVLIDGDLRLAATGTVTDRVGDSVLAFGHPFLSLGDVLLPMAKAEIVTVVPNLANSFKIGNIGRTVGRFDRDRPVGVHGVLGAVAPTIPMTVEVRGATDRRFELRLARVAPLAGALVATSLFGALDAANGTGGEQVIDLKARLDLAGREPLTLSQSFDGPGAAASATVHLLTVVSFLASNSLEQVEIESVHVDVEQRSGRRSARVLSAHPSRRVVRAGERLELMVELDPYRGERRRHRLELEVPADVEPGRYILLVGDGTSIDAARLQLERFEPTRLSQALAFLDGLHSRSDLAVLGVAADPGLEIGGDVLPRLPGSIRDIWGTGDASGVSILSTAIRQELAEDLGMPLAGLVRADLQVRARKSG